MSAHSASNLPASHFWGPVTATLDWCEANYQFSHYVAESANTWSNLVTIGLALLCVAQALSAELPKRYLVGYAGFALIGLGSFVFHATLTYEAQLADELPMIYVVSYCASMMFDSQRGFSLRTPTSLSIITLFFVFNILFTYSYFVYRNPVYHQAVFASLMFINAGRTAYLLHHSKLPEAIQKWIARCFMKGALTFAFGFLVWNLDNIFCHTVTGWKHNITWPTAFILEGHAWWHIFTAIGTYFMLIGDTYFTLCLKDDYNNYRMGKVLGLPKIYRVAKTKTQ